MDKKVVLSSGDIKLDYEIVDIVYAFQLTEDDYSPGEEEFLKSMPELNEKLRQTAIKKGCDAVIWIRYEYLYGEDVECSLTAYGTGVKIKK